VGGGGVLGAQNVKKMTAYFVNSFLVPRGVRVPQEGGPLREKKGGRKPRGVAFENHHFRKGEKNFVRGRKKLLIL